MIYLPIDKYDSKFTNWIHIIGGGTVSHVRSHLAIAAPAYGTTAYRLWEFASSGNVQYSAALWLTRMAAPHGQKATSPETNHDVAEMLEHLLPISTTKIIFFNPAMVDYEGSIMGGDVKEGTFPHATKRGKYEPRLKTSEGSKGMYLEPAPKIINIIKQKRPDILLAGFKTTCGADFDEQFKAGTNLVDKAQCDLVLANDIKTRENMLIVKKGLYFQTTNRDEALRELFMQTIKRAG